MTTISRICVSIAAVLLAACGAVDDEPRPEPPPIEDTAFGDMAGALEKARAVENTMLEHKEDLDQAMRESEGAH